MAYDSQKVRAKENMNLATLGPANDKHHKAFRVSQFFAKLYMGPDFPSLADEIAEQRPDISFKVTTFTNKQIVILYHLLVHTNQIHMLD